VQHAGFCVQAASKKKDVRLTITLECTEQKAAGVQGMSRYTTEKVSKRNRISAARSRAVLVASRRDFPGNRFHEKTRTGFLGFGVRVGFGGDCRDVGAWRAGGSLPNATGTAVVTLV
jgi:ribosomal protein L33